MTGGNARVEFWTALMRGWRGKCPRCGGGALFNGFLRMSNQCANCALVLQPYRADDAPAYFTILVVGHIVVPMVLLFERYGEQPPLWFHAVLWLPLSVVLALYLLPHIKGSVIALLWAHGLQGSKSSARGFDPS